MQSGAKCHAVAAVGMVSISALVASAGSPTHTWLSPVDGSWSIGANWNTGSVPGSGNSVGLGLMGAYSVSATGLNSALSLEISNPSATLQIGNGGTFDLFGNLENDGLVVVNLGAGGSTTSFDFESNATISGSGSIRLDSPATRARIRSGAGMSVTQQPGHTIAGYGQIEANFINNGLVHADLFSTTLSMTADPKVNNAIMRSSNGATLEISSSSVSQSPGGMIEALGMGSQVRFVSATITGGQLQTDTDATISFSGTTANGISLAAGDFRLLSGSTLDVFDSLTNNATLTINLGGGGATTQLDFENTGSLLGSGTIVLDSLASRARLRTAIGATMTNCANHTIRGWGQIEAAMINNGLVSADIPGQELFLLTDDKANTSTMQAINAGILDAGAIMIDQTGGGEMVADGANSRIDLNSTTVIGGDINGVNGGSVDISSATLNAVTLDGTANLLNGRTLDVFNSLTNNATLTVSPGGGGAATQLDFENSGSLLGSGSIVLDSFATRARMRTATGATMTNSASHTIRGYGQIDAAMINNGLVSADVPNQELFLAADDKVNNSTMRAINAGVLDAGAITIDQGSSGEMVANGVNSRIDLNSTTVIGGDIISMNSALINIASATLDAVTLEGEANLLNGRTLGVFNSLTNNGTLTINPGAGGSATQFQFENSGSLFGSGSIVLDSPATRARMRTAIGATMTNSASHTIRGYGQIDAAMINNGLVSADVPNQELFLAADDKVNNNTMRAINASILGAGAITIDQGSSGEMVADGVNSRIGLNSTTVIGGDIISMNSARINIASATLDAVTLEGEADLLNGGTINVLNSPTNNGTLTINPGGGGSATRINWLDDSIIQGIGTIILDSFSTRARITVGPDATVATLGQDQRLTGSGSIDAPFMHHGTTAPGAIIGTMLATQPITYSDSSVFEAEVDGSSADLLDSSSTIALEGTLEVVYANGFAPSGFWERTIIEGNGITGAFDSVIAPPAPMGLVTKVVVTATSVRVGQTCLSDINIDGQLNFFDVSSFLNAFSSQLPSGDMNGDGLYNFFDVSAFLNNFGGGCSL